ncbi:MAG: hypothetical protein ACRDHZ_17975 [Ktedonobacteraceae bacterium]
MKKIVIVVKQGQQDRGGYHPEQVGPSLVGGVFHVQQQSHQVPGPDETVFFREKGAFT